MHEVTVYAVEDGKVKARIKRDPYADWKQAMAEDIDRGLGKDAKVQQQQGEE